MNVYCGGACLVRPMIRMSQMAASVESRGMNLMHSLFFLKATSSAGKNKERRESIWSTGSPVSFPFWQRKGLVVHGPTAGSQVCGAAAQPFPAERGAHGARRARALRQPSDTGTRTPAREHTSSHRLFSLSLFTVEIFKHSPKCVTPHVPVI